MAKTNQSLAKQIEEILTTEIPGTPKVNLRKTAQSLAAMLTTDIPGTPRTADIARKIAELMTREIPGTESIGTRATVNAFSKTGRVQYQRLRGSLKDLSARAQQVVEALDRHGHRGTSADLQKWLKVNRNVIAGALHELREAGLIRGNRIGG